MSKILISKSHPQPATKKAPAGGKTIVTRMRITSEALTDMSYVYGTLESVVESRGVATWLTCGVAAVAAEITAGG